MKTLTNFPTLIPETKELVGIFTNRAAAKEFRRQLWIGLVPNELGSTEGRIIESKTGWFCVYATRKM